MPLPALYLDENVSPVVAQILASRKFDVLTACDAGMLRRSDPDQLAFAASVGRCLVSQNVADFVPVHAAWMHAKREHAGILLNVHDPKPSVLASKILKRLARETAASATSQLLYA
jgi:predicted nuclease of predicted toxin-antitoxin system